LKARPELNGRVGRVVSPAASGRVGVQIDGRDKPLLIKLSNLTLASEEPGGGTAASPDATPPAAPGATASPSKSAKKKAKKKAKAQENAQEQAKAQEIAGQFGPILQEAIENECSASTAADKSAAAAALKPQLQRLAVPYGGRESCMDRARLQLCCKAAVNAGAEHCLAQLIEYALGQSRHDDLRELDLNDRICDTVAKHRASHPEILAVVLQHGGILTHGALSALAAKRTALAEVIRALHLSTGIRRGMRPCPPHR
jgi:hypothetical protein